MRILTPFWIKINLRENRFLRQGGHLATKNGTDNVKFLAGK